MSETRPAVGHPCRVIGAIVPWRRSAPFPRAASPTPGTRMPRAPTRRRWHLGHTAARALPGRAVHYGQSGASPTRWSRSAYGRTRSARGLHPVLLAQLLHHEARTVQHRDAGLVRPPDHDARCEPPVGDAHGEDAALLRPDRLLHRHHALRWSRRTASVLPGQRRPAAVPGLVQRRARLEDSNNVSGPTDAAARPTLRRGPTETAAPNSAATLTQTPS